MTTPLSFLTDGPAHVVDLRSRTGPGPRVRLRVYPTYNPTDMPDRTALDYLCGETVLIDGVERVIHSVETFAKGGAYRAGLAIGLAVVEDESCLPAPVAEAVRRAAKRIEEAAGTLAISHDSQSVESLVEVITEELRPVLLGGPPPSPVSSPETWATAVGMPWTVLNAAALAPQGRGCIGTRYCHACKVSYGGTCLCNPNKCHDCGAECGTTPPPKGEIYQHRMHY